MRSLLYFCIVNLKAAKIELMRIIDNQHLKNKIVKNCNTVYDKINHEVNKISGQGRTLTIASCL